MPVTWFVLFLLARYRRDLAHRPLLWMLGGVSAAQMTAVAGFTPWFGGGCFGPRYSTELVPGLLVAAVLGVAAMRRRREAQTALEPLRATGRNWVLVSGTAAAVVEYRH